MRAEVMLLPVPGSCLATPPSTQLHPVPYCARGASPCFTVCSAIAVPRMLPAAMFITCTPLSRRA